MAAFHQAAAADGLVHGRDPELRKGVDLVERRAVESADDDVLHGHVPE
jgi:hypothetical protein